MNRLFTYIKRNTRYSVLAVLLVLVVATGAYFVFRKTSKDEVATATETRAVKLVSVASLTEEGAPLTLTGEVRSSSEAELRAEAGGQVTGVYVKAGQYVGAGTILAETENAAQRASVQSAKGALDAARANLQKTRVGARTEDRTNVAAQEQGARTSLEQARIAGKNAFGQSYTSAQDAIQAKTDTFFTSPLTVRPQFKINSATYDEQVVIQDERVALGDELETWQKETQTLSANGDVASALSRAQTRLTRIKRFLDSIGLYISKQQTSSKTAEDIATDKATINAARTEVDGALSSVTAAQQALAGAQSGAVAAASAQEKVAAGAQPEDIQLSEAAVTQAQGAYNAALAGLEKTRVRTPIAGQVSTISAKSGDYITPGTTVAVVANKAGLEIETFVSADTKNRVNVGDSVLIDGSYKGIVTNVEPGLDPVTKKSRVHVGLSGATDLTHGQFVDLVITSDSTTPASAKRSDGFYIPISAIKVLPSSLVVFIVTASSTLESHTIKEGSIIGDTMIIKEGITSDMDIVLDARGHNDGDVVEIGQ